MQLLYKLHRSKKPTFTNFGDELNLWIWPELLGNLLDDYNDALLVGIGTVLDDTLPHEPTKIILGAGNGYRPAPTLDDKYRIYCVRGPLTARVLGLPEHKAACDPAVLVRHLYTSDLDAKREGVLLIPHHTNAQADWSFACRELGMRYITPLQPWQDVLKAIGKAELVVTEAMHGAIVADALRVPWVPITSHVSSCPFKWTDWTSSVGLSYAPISLPGIWNSRPMIDGWLHKAKSLIKKRLFIQRLNPNKLRSRAILSSENILDRRVSQLLDEVDRLRKDATKMGWSRNSLHTKP